MYISQELRQKNIAEYLLYMWQMEDLIRAFDCSLKRIKQEYISRFDYTDEQKEEVADWFGNLVTMMNREGKRKEGHLQINAILIQDLNELHNKLLDSSLFPFYRAEYYKVLPFIVELRNRGSKDINEIETIFNALYGVMILRLQGKEISTETQHAMKEITTFTGMLSDYWIKDHKGELKWDEE